MPSFEKMVHPMVSVPDAIRLVLREAARVLVENREESSVSEAMPVASLEELLGRRLVDPVYMPEPGYPDYAASIMDGYAIRSSAKRQTRMIVDRKALAGDYPIVAAAEAHTNEETAAYYITTGAVMPEGCDCVLPIELCQVNGNLLNLSDEAIVNPGEWIRPVGCDISAGSLVLPKGQVIDPVSLGLLLQAGVSTVQVRKSLKVGVLSTGNELLTAREAPAAGKIPDVNRPILLGLLKEFGPCYKPIDLGTARDDDLEYLTDTLRTSFQHCDVILTTGGISMGESDVLEQVMVQKLGGILHFGRLHMKPGKPTTFLTLQPDNGPTKFCFCLPGNPVSATVCTRLLVQPCLELLYNGPDDSADTHGESPRDMIHRIVENAWVHPERTMTLAHGVKLDSERPEYHRVITTDENRVTSTGVQRSSRLMSLRDAQGLLVLPQAVGERKIAHAEESFTVLLLTNSLMGGTQVYRSLHLGRNNKEQFSISVTYVVDPGTPDVGNRLKGVSKQVEVALSGSKSGKAAVVSTICFAGQAGDLFDACTTPTTSSSNDIDVFVIISQCSFCHHLDIAAELRQRLVKVADAIALQARRGAASQDAAVGALMETVVGYAGNKGSMMILVPQQGLQGGLHNVRGLLKHALQVARGDDS